jgi:hypothetical protein
MMRVINSFFGIDMGVRPIMAIPMTALTQRISHPRVAIVTISLEFF